MEEVIRSFRGGDPNFGWSLLLEGKDTDDWPCLGQDIWIGSKEATQHLP